MAALLAQVRQSLYVMAVNILPESYMAALSDKAGNRVLCCGTGSYPQTVLNSIDVLRYFLPFPLQLCFLSHLIFTAVHASLVAHL